MLCREKDGYNINADSCIHASPFSVFRFLVIRFWYVSSWLFTKGDKCQTKHPKRFMNIKGRGQSSTQYPPIRRTISRALKPKMKVPPSSASSFLDEAIGSRAEPMISDAKNIKGFCNSK